jgi:hypothetical protein
MEICPAFLLGPEWFDTGGADFTNNYDGGGCTADKEIVDLICDRRRELAHVSTGMQGFLCCHSFGRRSAAEAVGYLLLDRRS